MEKFTTLNESTTPKVRTAIQTKLNELKELGLHIELKGITYSSDSFTAKIKAQIVKEGEDPKPLSQINWEKGFYAKHGVPKDALGKTITLQGSTYTIIGCSDRKMKNCIVVKHNGNGQTYNCSASMITNALK